MAYTTEEKVRLIDNDENKSVVAHSIVNDIFERYQIDSDSNTPVWGWLYDRIMGDSLYEILTNEQKIYIVQLAKKCASDIVFMAGDRIGSDNFMSIVRGFGDIGSFIERVVNEYFVHSDELLMIASDVASTIGYEDTLVVDDTAYIYDNGSEETILVDMNLFIDHHPNYHTREIKRRIRKRLRYKWNTSIKLMDITENENGTFLARVAFIAPKSDIGNIEDMIDYRFGSKSGKPWYRCHLCGFGITC